MDSLNSLLSRWFSDPSIGSNLVAWKTMPARKAISFPFPDTIHPAIAYAFKQTGITSLYTHQKEVWDLTRTGKNITIVTGTASGKSICYNLPVLNDLLSNHEARGLYIFPTKALAQDQLSSLKKILSAALFYLSANNTTMNIGPATYDGDTSLNSRTAIRNHSRLVITNPDMLHTGILPQHARWSSFFKGLIYVVIDEIHVYRGVFGSHVANVIRRLKRIASFYGANIRFILTSATIGNPRELAETLIESPVSLVNTDGSPKGEKHFLIYNPPIIDVELGLRASLIKESIRLAEDLFTSKIQTIMFGRTRPIVEVILTYLRSKVALQNHPETLIGVMVRAYRSGYLPQQRREIEAGLRNGNVRIVIATTALELGIDIGQMGAVVMAGFAGTIAGTWQQAGRAGRGNAPSIAVLVTSSSPIDQYLAQHPEFIFEQPHEQARLDPNNLLIYLDHLRCALFELPINDDQPFGNVDHTLTIECLEYLQESGILYKSNQKFYWGSDIYPAGNVSLRNASTSTFLLQDISKERNKTIGTIDNQSIYWLAHPQAIYLHEGDTFLVENLDFENKMVSLRPTYVDYYTKPRHEVEVNLLEIKMEEIVQGGIKTYGEISVIERVIGYQKIRWGTQEKLGSFELTLPKFELNTVGYILKLEEVTIDRLRGKGLWNNDPNEYGPNWKHQKIAARERDRFICQSCGIPERKSSHHVHHKTPFRLFSSYLEANALENLITLCPSCHNRVELTVRIRSGLAGLSYILGNLASLFLMCDPRDLGVFYDPQSPLNNKLPVIVVFDRVPGGIGFSQHLYTIHNEIIKQAHNLASTCQCDSGCPSCVGPGGEEGNGSKKETLALLDLLKT